MWLGLLRFVCRFVFLDSFCFACEWIYRPKERCSPNGICKIERQNLLIVFEWDVFAFRITLVHHNNILTTKYPIGQIRANKFVCCFCICLHLPVARRSQWIWLTFDLKVAHHRVVFWLEIKSLATISSPHEAMSETKNMCKYLDNQMHVMHLTNGDRDSMIPWLCKQMKMFIKKSQVINDLHGFSEMHRNTMPNMTKPIYMADNLSNHHWPYDCNANVGVVDPRPVAPLSLCLCNG